jgi:sugar O-acyltransferase (sialic acid O-acetyltransferase NeuD family)
MRLYGIVGAGGHGRQVMPVAKKMLETTESGSDFEIVFVVEFGSTETVNGYPVLTAEDFLARTCKKYFNVSIANSLARERVASRFIAGGAEPFSITASNCVTLDNNDIGEGAIFSPFTTVTSNVKIGRFFHANISSYVEHDCQIGDFVTFAPNVHCNGRIVIEDHVYIGAGAIIREGSPGKPLVIGRGAVVGMGAVVTRSVEPGITVVGNPARPMTSGRK